MPQQLRSDVSPCYSTAAKHTEPGTDSFIYDSKGKNSFESYRQSTFSNGIIQDNLLRTIRDNHRVKMYYRDEEYQNEKAREMI